MNKVKITVLKTTLDEELAQQYGVKGLTACPMLREGQVFYAIMRSRRAFATRHGKPFISMCLHWHTVRAMRRFILAIGSGSLVWPFAAAMTACGRLFLSWKRRKNLPHSIIRLYAETGGE